MDTALALSEEATVKRFNDEQDRIARDFGYGQTAGALKITKDCLKTLTDYLQSKIDNIPNLSEGDHEKDLLRLIRHLPTEIIGLSTLNVALNSVALGKNDLHTRIALGSAIASEAWAAGLLEANEKLAKRIERAARRKHGNVQYRKQAARSIAARAGYRSKTWDRGLLIKAGNVLLDYVLRALPDVFTLDRVEGVSSYLTISDGALALAEQAVEQVLQQRPVFLPSTDPIKPWTSWLDGGYWDEWARLKAPFVRTHHKETAGAIRAAWKDGAMQPHVDAVNYLQSTAWTINKPVLEVLKAAYEAGLEVEGLPSKKDIPLPAKPRSWEQMDKDARRLWKHRVSQTKQHNRSVKAGRMLLKHDLETADRLAEAERFWTPMNCDWRGRVYSVPHFNFQRDDRVRALFLFADGQPIGEEGLRWLKVHVANCWGRDKIDKLPLEERIAWVDEQVRLGLIQANAETPLALAWTHEDHQWTRAKQPFLFLAACMELTAALVAGPQYVTRLPVSFDGSCSGLQHLAAMTRDEQTAKLVNLIPSETPQDVYQAVADLVSKTVQACAAGSDAHASEIAELWLAHGIDRDVVKRNVMTYSYSSKKFGMAAQLCEDLMRPLEFAVLAGKLPAHPFAHPSDRVVKEGFKVIERAPGTAAAKFLAGHVYEAIEALVQKPAEAMQMLQKIARALAHEGKPANWTTPLGLPWVNRYHVPNLKTLNLWMHDKRVRSVYADGYQKEIDKDKAANGIAPNFVHALDACHLLSVAAASRDAGITGIATVHDSFGCLAPDAARFNQIIREEFVNLYEEHDVLAEVLAQAQHDLTVHNWQRLPHVPTCGSLNLKEVLNADFAFA